MEQLRIKALCERLGEPMVKAWAVRTMETYRAAMTNPAHFASQPDWKPRFEQSIRELDDFVGDIA